jgi:hypothetical protein
MESILKNNKLIMYGAGAAALAALAYFGYSYYRKKKEEQEEIAASTSDIPGIPGGIPNFKPRSSASDSLPVINSSPNILLKQGSRGDNVRQLQQSLNDKYGANLKVDGAFGKGTLSALQKAGFPSVVDSSLFNLITSSESTGGKEIASKIANQILRKDFNAVIKLLKQLKNTSDYQETNQYFLQIRAGGARTTLLNRLFKTFTEPRQKQTLQIEFIRMGLKFNGQTWSLEGLGRFRGLKKLLRIKQQLKTLMFNKLRGLKKGLKPKKVVTTHETKVFNANGQSLTVSAGTVLGIALRRLQNTTLFQNSSGQSLYVENKNIRYV